MRCLILISLCFVLANANWLTKNRFHHLLNRYQNRFDTPQTLLGSDDLDDYIQDYVEEIRRERMCERDQCPRGLEDIMLDTEDDEHEGMYDMYDMEDMMPSRKYFGGEEDVETRSPMLKEVEEANVRLATRLYKECKDEKDDKNTVVSPMSIQLALAALNHGARGNTKRQIGRAIGGRLQKHERRQVFKMLIRHLKGLRNIDYSTGKHSTKINTVTGIFVSQTTRAQQMFIQQVKTNMGATVKHCSFSQQPQQCRKSINQWMAQKTHHKLTHIVPQDAITDNTKMILINALEMKAQWGPQMRRHVTKEAKFYPLDTKKVKIVEVMETEGRFKYYEDELVKIVGVPTKEQELTLYTIVPKDKDGLTEVEKLHLQDSVQLKQLLDQTDKHVRRVELQLPKFQIKHKIDVRRTLRKQGVTDAFDPQRADFSGITGVNKYEQDETEYGFEKVSPFRRNPFFETESEYGMMSEDFTGRRETKLHLNKFIHQCTIKVTESGISATTGSQTEEYEQEYERETYGRLGLKKMMDTEDMDMDMDTMDEVSGMFRRESTNGEKIVKANRAFAFVVKHNPTNQLLLVGRVIDAAQKKVGQPMYQTINNVDQL